MLDLIKRFRQRKLPTPPVPLAKFCSDQQAVDRMREITNDPTFQQAVACLKAHHVPLQTSVRATAEFNNNSLVFYAGYCAALDDLSVRATKLHQPRQQDPNETDEWTHIQLNKL